MNTFKLIFIIFSYLIPTTVFCQNFAPLYFSIGNEKGTEYYKFSIDTTFIDHNNLKVYSLSPKRFEGIKSFDIQLTIVETNYPEGLTIDEFIEDFQNRYNSQGVHTIVDYFNDQKFLLAGISEKNYDNVSDSTYQMTAQTIHKNNIFSFAISTPYYSQIDWIFNIIEDTSFY